MPAKTPKTAGQSVPGRRKLKGFQPVSGDGFKPMSLQSVRSRAQSTRDVDNEGGASGTE